MRVKAILAAIEKRSRASPKISAAVMLGYSALLWSALVSYVLIANRAEQATADPGLLFEDIAGDQQKASTLTRIGVDASSRIGGRACWDCWSALEHKNPSMR